jgi:superfamily II DNA helicase RecQ
VLVHRIGAVEQPVLQRAVGRFARRFEDRAVAAEQPAVIAAANAGVADQAEFERGAAMRAMQLQKADLAALVAERDQVLAEDAQRRGTSPNSLARTTGCQKRRRYSPHGVPGPTRVSSSSSGGNPRW